MNYPYKILLIFIFLIISSCDTETKQNDKYEKKELSKKLTDSEVFYSNTFRHMAIVSGKLQEDTLIVNIEIFENSVEVTRRLQKTDSVHTAQNRTGNYRLNSQEPIKVGKPKRHVILKFIEEFKDEEKPLFEGIYLNDKTNQMHIPKKKVILKY